MRLLGLEDGTEVHVAPVELLHGLLDTGLGHGEDLHDGGDLVQGSELQHVPVDLPGGNDGPLDGDAARQQGHVGDLEVALGHGEGVDGGSGGHDGHELLPVGLRGGGDEETVQLVRDLQLLDILCGDELVGSQPQGLLLLSVRPGKNDDAAAHLGGELDGQVAKTTNTHDTDSLGGLGVVRTQSVVDSGAAALHGSGVLVAEAIGDLEQESLAPDGVRGEGTLVQVGAGVHLAAGAVGLGTGQAEVAVPAGVVLVSPTDAVTLLQHLDLGTNGLYHTDTLVAENHVRGLVVQIGSAEAGGGDLQQDLVAGKLIGLGGGGLLRNTVLAALEDCERRHVVCDWLSV